LTIQTSLVSAADLSNWFDSSIHGLKIPSRDRETMAAALFDQVHEHHKAIQLLLKNSFIGSAFSLERSVFENFVRGVWLWRCASDKDVERFKTDKINRGIDDLIVEIEKGPGYNRSVLSKIKKTAWKAMCSYAHGGYLQSVRRITPGSITPRYTEGEMLELINFSEIVALLAAYEIFSMAKREDLMRDMLERMRNALWLDRNINSQFEQGSK
jgi:uncharacterized protein DUF6988